MNPGSNNLDAATDQFAFVRQKIEDIIAWERAGREITAALGLAVLRAEYEQFNLDDLPADERTWPDFVAKHLPFGLPRANQLMGRMVLRGGPLRCVSCGASATCACSCGAAYVAAHPWIEPARDTPMARAIAAVTAHPEKSNRAIAAEIGVGDQTVRRARQQISGAQGHGAVAGAVEERVGRDGRRRKVTGTAR